MKYPTRHFFFRYTHERLGKCVYLETTSDQWDISWYTTKKRCITILYHAIANTEANTMGHARRR